MTTLLTLDPGGTTGYSLWSVNDSDPIRLLEHGQWQSGIDGVISNQVVICRADILVSESFVDDGRTPKPDVQALRIEGALMTMRALAGQSAPIFQRNVYKAHAPDELLRRTGYWKKGQPHATDAIRHAIAWAKTRGHRPTIESLWPVPEMN
ncbi:hypothetical protein G7068_16105 [Leucobacter viscericola]|uniref:Uncharacterized protein n=1 Tax=Leucobacter viscericola TaxID=2714935 RepID=A0A6G7XIZ5_9MICO|nr:hypothetical protein [Leucobacter viscericola]QIK61788.1 hypothetical protein G7068_00115 [Leucobacter viscericola]QIK64570.1 hypothetical protein G7068_16105 [Leucobacter viscericola]